MLMSKCISDDIIYMFHTCQVVICKICVGFKFKNKRPWRKNCNVTNLKNHIFTVCKEKMETERKKRKQRKSVRIVRSGKRWFEECGL